MDESQRKRAPSNSSARRLFTERSPLRSQSGQARRKLVLVSDDHQTSDGDIDPMKREPNVVARLMGLEPLPGAKQQEQHLIIKSNQQHQHHHQQQQRVVQQVQLHELLKIKEPLLLKELLRESDEHAPSSASSRKPSLMEKFAGLVKRRPEERGRKHHPGSASSSPVRSPIKSPIKSKRGLMLEAAVKFLDVDSPQPPPQTTHQKHHLHHHHRQQEELRLKKKNLNLSRSSSEPCLSSSSQSKVGIRAELKGGLVKLSEFSKKLSSASSSKEGKVQSKGGSGNLVRSKSDLGLEKATRKHQVGGLGLGLFHHQSGKQELDHSHEQSLSSSEKTGSKTTSSSNSTTGIGFLRLFGNHRCKERRATGDGHADPSEPSSNATKRSSEPSSALVRAGALLLRRKNTPTKPPRQRCCQVSSPALSHLQSSDDPTSSESSLQFSDEFSDDSTRSETSGASPSSSSSSRLEKSCQPSPVSVLEAGFVDDQVSSCTSVEDSPETPSSSPPEDDSRVATSAPGTSDNIINAMILDISRIRCLDLSAIGFSNEYRSPCRENFIDQVLTTSESLWEGTSSSGLDWYDEGLPIRHETFAVMESKLGKTGTRSGSFEARKLMFHCVDEAVNTRIRWSSRTRLPRPRMRNPEMISQIQDQLQEWSSMTSCSTDQLVDRDMSVGAGKWRDWDQQVEEIARELECSILRKMIEEVVRELS